MWCIITSLCLAGFIKRPSSSGDNFVFGLFAASFLFQKSCGLHLTSFVRSPYWRLFSLMNHQAVYFCLFSDLLLSCSTFQIFGVLEKCLRNAWEMLDKFPSVNFVYAWVWTFSKFSVQDISFKPASSTQTSAFEITLLPLKLFNTFWTN